MAAYYNEIDFHAAAWLRELIKAGHIADGDVDTRSIADVSADDVRGYTQCHFFAGIGGWSYALRLAKWSDDMPVWTGSCPCQPFSVAGKNRGTEDERHLWPEWYRLIKECRPPIVFGEQVAAKDGLAWFDLVSTDMEETGSAIGAADLCAASVGAPHIRQRLYFVGMADTTGLLSVERNDHGKGGSTCRKSIFKSGNSDSAQVSAASSWMHPEPAPHPLADGLSRNVAAVRGYGNAIVPQVAATFIAAVM